MPPFDPNGLTPSSQLTGDRAERTLAHLRKRKPVDEVKRIVHGAVGLVKAALNIDPVSPEVLAERTATCMSCPQVHLDMTQQPWKCKVCGCRMRQKIKIASEVCPEGRWGPAPRSES